MTKYEPASEEITTRALDVLQKHHADLAEAEVTFAVLMASNKNDVGEELGPPLKKNGFSVLALSKINAHENRIQGLPDFTLKIDAHAWAKMKGRQQSALLDHALERLEPTTDKDGELLFDAGGRPQLHHRKPDHYLELFDAVALRHGEHSIEVAMTRRLFEDDTRQLYLRGLEPIAGEAQKSRAKPPKLADAPEPKPARLKPVPETAESANGIA